MKITKFGEGETGKTILLGEFIRYKIDFVDIDHYVHEIIDREGTLEVHWFTKPTENIRQIIEDCWEFINKNHVEHYIFKVKK